MSNQLTIGVLRLVVRLGLGLLLICHACAHAVLPIRGVLTWPPATLTDVLAGASFAIAVVALFAAGIGLLGSRLLRGRVDRLFGVGIVSSLVALTLGWNPSSWWGLALDAAVAGAFVGSRHLGLIAWAGPGAHVSPPWTWWRRLREAAACGLVLYVAAGAALFPWYRTWGTTDAERAMPLPGDQQPRTPAVELMHGITIDVPPEHVWPWLVQIGQDRAGFYSYDWLERLFGAHIHNASQIRPEWQHRETGDLVRAAQANYLGGLFGTEVGWRISELEPGRAMVLENWGAFVLESTPKGHTRLLVRSTIGGPDTPVWAAALTFALFELPHFIMERRMMLGIKERAEWHYRHELASIGEIPRTA